MKIGRNDACPCGSGKKYKKCCLPKDEARERELRLQVQDEGPGGSAYRPDPIEPDEPEEDWPVIQGDEEEGEGLDSDREPEPAHDSEEDEMVDSDEYPQVDLTLPDLSAEDQAVVDRWWKEVEPYYKNNDSEAMLRQLQSFLDTKPDLFPHLGVDEEFIFELGAELGRRQEWQVYADLLERLRREQPKAYSFAFYIFDYELIVERVVRGRTDEISYFLSFFKEFPDSGPDFCSYAINLLAWRGLEQPLYELAEATAVPLLTSSKVLNGAFSMQWLIAREIIPFLEMKDASASATNAVMDGLNALSKRLKYRLTPDRGRVRRQLKMTAAPASEIKLRDYRPKNRQFAKDLAWNFSGFLRANWDVNWIQSLFLSENLENYMWWHENKRKNPFLFTPADVEHCFTAITQQFFHQEGVRMMSSIQTLAWLADYLRSSGEITELKRQQIRELARDLFEKGRKAVDSTDPAYRLVSTFDQLAPEADSS